MPLAVVTNRCQTEQARRALERALASHCARFKWWVGWQGGSRFCNVFWDPTNCFWFSFLLIGTEDPSVVKNLRISCEINPPKSGMNRRCAGVFLINPLGDVYVAHTGGRSRSLRAPLPRTGKLSSGRTDSVPKC